MKRPSESLPFAKQQQEQHSKRRKPYQLPKGLLFLYKWRDDDDGVGQSRAMETGQSCHDEGEVLNF